MFGGAKIKLEKGLLDRATAAAKQAGFSSVDEFVAAAVEKELTRLQGDANPDERVEDRLRGLGYIE